MGLTALQIVKQACFRVGVLPPPIHLHYTWSTDDVYTDDGKSEILWKVALDEAVVNATISADWIELCQVAEFRSVVDPTVEVEDYYDPGIKGYNLDVISPFMDRMISIYVVNKEKTEERIYFSGIQNFEDSVNYRSSWKENTAVIMKQHWLSFVKDLHTHVVDSVVTPYTYGFIYKTRAGVIGAEGELKLYVSRDDDTFFLDDELLILGTVLNWKKRQGMNVQTDTGIYNHYLEHLQQARQPTTVVNFATLRENYANGHVFPWYYLGA